MNIGFSKKEITGTLPANLAGFAKERIAYEIHDKLYVNALVFEANTGEIVLFSLDLLNVDHFIVDEVRNALVRRGVAIEDIHLFATHTHSAPGGISDVTKTVLIGKQSFLNEMNSEYINFIVQQCIKAYLDAKLQMEESLIAIGKGNVHGVGNNRNKKERKGDDSLFVIDITQKSGRKALFYNFACHPTVLNMNSTMISADIPGAVRETFLEYDVVFFVNGACGDISTRFTRQRSDVTELKRYANIIKNAIQGALEKPIYQGALTRIKSCQQFIPLTLKTPLSIEEAMHQLDIQNEIYEKQEQQALHTQELRLAKSFVEGALADLEYANHHEDVMCYSLEINYIQIQTELIVTIPAELFSELGNILKHQTTCQIFGYANGYYLYIADMIAYDEKTYESASSPFEKGQGEYLIQEILKKIGEKG